jgi:acyl-CoA reductase-like NAD-dependent aldehyde dehydrogenase
MIDAPAVARTARLIAQAIAGGARVISGGRPHGAYFDPTILTDVAREADVNCEEAFAPVVVVSTFNDLDDALARANDSRFGL